MSEPNWANQTIFTGDNLPIMRGMNSESVDLIYLDPPFNSKRDYAAPIGSAAAGAEFKDTWTLSDIDCAWLDLIEHKHPKLWRVIQATMTKSDQSYLVYMAVRLLEMHRLLKPTSSIYLHCDPTMSHYLKLVMDAVFGKRNFLNEIVWCYSSPCNVTKHFPRKHDTILFYGKSETNIFNKNSVRVPYKSINTQTNRHGEKGGGIGGMVDAQMRLDLLERGKIPESWWTKFSPVGRLKRERTGYPTQKPLALLQRIIKASTNEGDVVLDPFAGCATTCVAAQIESRQWVGIDVSSLAYDLVNRRMKENSELGFNEYSKSIHRTDIPRRTDIEGLLKYNHPGNKKTLYGEQGGLCNGCGTLFEPRHLEVDHIIPRTHGGSDHLENLQLLCSSCNRIKGDRGMEYLLTKLAA